MSKSQGNVVDPADVIKKNGAEILRLWVAYEDYGQDVTISQEQFLRISDTYRRIRNTFRFILGNLTDFNPAKDSVPVEKLPPLDRWALARLNQLIHKATEAFESYDFYKVYHGLNQFFTVDLSATYLDILKDRLYTWKADGEARRSSLTVLYLILDHLTRMMAPILSFLAEETYSYIPGRQAESVFLTDYPKPVKAWEAPELEEYFVRILEIRAETSKVLEKLRQEKTIGSSLDAMVTLTVSEAELAKLTPFKDHLQEILIVSKLVLQKGTFSVSAQPAPGGKCVRCWHYDDLGKDPNHPELCPKCLKAL